MDKCYNNAVCKILKDAEKEMLELCHPYVGTEHLLLSLLRKTKIKNLCFKYNLTYNSFKSELIDIIGKANKASEYILYTPLLKLVIDNAYNKSNEDQEEMDELYLFSALINENDGIALRIIDNMGIDLKDLNKELNKPVLANELGINLNYKVSDEKILLREKEINEIMQILLRRNKNNPLLLGKAGVGKTAIVEELARRIKSGKVPSQLKDKEIILINTSTLIAGTKYRGEFEERVNNLIKEVIQNKNVILFIDEIHTIVKTGSSDGSIDAANILKPYLARGELSIIGATTTEEYNDFIKKDSALNRRFAPIIVNEPSSKDMEYILSNVKKNFEKYYDLKITKKSILTLIEDCDLYMPNLHNPDKCIDILDTTCSKKKLDNFQNNSQDNIITPINIHEVIMIRTNLILTDESKTKKISNELINKYDSEEINNILKIINSHKLSNYQILKCQEKDQKLEIIKSIAGKLHINLIVIDCQEYNDEYSLNKLLASNYLYDQISENPYSIVVFNNYEQTGRILHNLIYTMTHNGYISNNRNEKILLNNAIIFLLDNSKQSTIGFTDENNLLITG